MDLETKRERETKREPMAVYTSLLINITLIYIHSLYNSGP